MHINSIYFRFANLAGLALGAFVLSVLPSYAQDGQQAAIDPQIEARAKAILRQRDADGDGKLSADEVGNPQLFTQVDANHDGFLALEEVGDYLQRQRNQPQQQQRPADGQRAPMVNSMGAMMRNRFTQMDKNGDGKITPDELPDQAVFTRMDLDGDGVIPLEEAMQTMAHYMGTGPGNPITPLTDMGTALYKGFPGGLYPGGNTPPADYLKLGLAAARKIQPLDREGQPSADGAIVLISVGMSNTTMEFSTFKRIADADPQKNPRLTIVDCAQGGMHAGLIKDPTHNYWTVTDQRLQQAGVTPKQVRVAWIKQAIAQEKRQFPDDARGLEDDLRQIVRILTDRYPNLFIIYLSSRTCAEFATSPLNPEPIAFQGGFAVKWLVEEHITAAQADPAAAAAAPWVAWGPYVWTDGLRGRADAFVWTPDDVAAGDGTHPSPQGGMVKVANLLLQFCKTDPTAKSWFVKP